MRWTLHIHRSVTHTGRHLPREVFEVVWPSVLNLKENPYPSGTAQVTGFDDVYQYLVAGYRVVYQLLTEERIIRVIRLHQP